jgi:hypothetical protein
LPDSGRRISPGTEDSASPVTFPADFFGKELKAVRTTRAATKQEQYNHPIQIMKTNQTILGILKHSTLLALALGSFALTSFAVHAKTEVPFRANWEADIATTPLAPPLVAISGLGAGQATHLGAMTAQSIAEVVNLATGEGAASYRFTAANGDDVFLNFLFLAIPTGPTTFAVQGAWQVAGGTGRLDGASGSGTYEGQVDFTGPASAVGHFELRGTISSPGSLK